MTDTNNKMNECREYNINLLPKNESIFLSMENYKLILDVSGTKNINIFRVYRDIIKFSKCNLKADLTDYINKEEVLIHYADDKFKISCDIPYQNFTKDKLNNLCGIINKIGYFKKEHGTENISKKLYDFKEELKNRDRHPLKISYSSKQIETGENPEIMMIKLDWLGAL